MTGLGEVPLKELACQVLKSGPAPLSATWLAKTGAALDDTALGLLEKCVAETDLLFRGKLGKMVLRNHVLDGEIELKPTAALRRIVEEPRFVLAEGVSEEVRVFSLKDLGSFDFLWLKSLLQNRRLGGRNPLRSPSLS